MKLLFRYIFPVLFVLFLMIFTLVFQLYNKKNYEELNEYSLGKIKDTILIASENYIEVNLIKQQATLVRKNDSTITYPISSGNPNISEGIETPDGIFTVQSKSPLAISKQFDDAKLFNWIGISGNVGFHGLEGKRYYGTLGKRASSHGCIRVSIEDGEKVYKLVKIGTPVIIYSKEPARIFKFIDSNKIYDKKYKILNQFSKFEKKLLNDRINDLYNGNYYINNLDKLVLTGNFSIKGWKLDVGDFSKIKNRQKEPLIGTFVYFLKDNCSIFCRDLHKLINKKLE